MKELKDFIHLYLGCMCQYRFLNAMGRVEKREGKLYGIKGSYCFLETNYGFIEERIEDIKLILRPLSDMTDDEMKELYLWVFKRPFVGDNITHRNIGKEQERHVLWSGCERLFVYKDGDVGADSDLQYYPIHAPFIVLWQLSKHFDLFGLIEAGLAIDKTTLK